MRATLVLLLALLGCASAPAQPAPTQPRAQAPALDAYADAGAADASGAPSARVATPAELEVVDGLMRITERLRRLPFREPVNVSIENRAAMRAYVLRTLDDAQLNRARRRYVALGALPADLDVRALLVEVMEDELIGYYDPKEKRLAVRVDVARSLGTRGSARSARSGGNEGEQSLAWRATVVHELVHALQDQHFALGRTMGATRVTDADNAFGALVEGDATLVMLAYTAELAGALPAAVLAQPDHVRHLMTRPPSQLSPALRRAPGLLREPLLFRYTEGAVFCATLFRAGGWDAVDRAHLAPPRETRAVHDPSRYLGGAAAPRLPVPDAAFLRAHGLEPVDDDVLGALELSVLLGLPSVRTSWRADRYLVLATPRGEASLWWLRLASPAAAKLVEARFDKLGDPARQVARDGARVLVARGVSPEAFAHARAWTEGAEARQGGSSEGAIDLPAPRASTRQAPPLQPSRRVRDAIAD